MKLAELEIQEYLTPSQLKQFRNRVRRFVFNPVNSTAAKHEYLDNIQKFAEENNGQVYTGIHSENDWTKERWWFKGWHLVNRTLNFVVIIPKKGE